LVARRLDSRQKRLFVIAGSKALRAAIDSVFGSQTTVQRCRNHQLENVLSHLPEQQQAPALMKSASKMSPKEGMRSAGWQRLFPAFRSLRTSAAEPLRGNFSIAVVNA
jgi:transposase-like protein